MRLVFVFLVFLCARHATAQHTVRSCAAGKLPKVLNYFVILDKIGSVRLSKIGAFCAGIFIARLTQH